MRPVEKELLKETGRAEKSGTLEIDEVFLTRQITGIIPNPWHCYQIGSKAVKMLLKIYDREIVATNFVFIIEELKRILDKERNRLSEEVFRQMVEQKKLCFFLIADKGGFMLPSRIKVKSNRQLFVTIIHPFKNHCLTMFPKRASTALKNRLPFILMNKKNYCGGTEI